MSQILFLNIVHPMLFHSGEILEIRILQAQSTGGQEP